MHDALGPGALRAGCQSTVELIEPLVIAARARGLRVEPIARRRRRRRASDAAGVAAARASPALAPAGAP